ncbi:MAG: hypothetical protein JZU60_03915, partial [Ilumatobacteraceae bacterium]|nr:hypothetical protein [Ilumatobacteraceae bacterium]
GLFKATQGGTAVPANTVSLDNHHGGLADSGDRLGRALSNWKLGSALRFDGALCAPAPAAYDPGRSEVFAHPREDPRSFLRGKCSGPGLFAWI